ncbi:MAG: hypothetical protein ACOC3B_03125 [Bacillota bacterium]
MTYEKFKLIKKGKIIIKKDILEEYMAKNNLTQKDFADIIGVDHTMVCRVMKEER